MLSVEYKNNDTYLHNAANFDLTQTLDCGQAFRWRSEDGIHWKGVAFRKELSLYRDGDTVVFCKTGKDDFEKIWRLYFDLDRDYSVILSAIEKNEILRSAADSANGIRILNQEPWEALCSFIISQNNNIPRIKGIIERLCEGFGKRIGDAYAFPSPETLASLSVEDLSPLRCGFRAKYIIDAAQKVANGTVALETLRNVSDEYARSTLMQICGVGPKVADCTLLFGLGHCEAFPRDVWIKRAMQQLFGGELPACATPYAGIVQQYIFHYARTTKLNF